MPKRNKAPEIGFQEHITTFLVRVHGYGVLDQADITTPYTPSPKTSSGPF